MPIEGLITVRSGRGPAETFARVEADISARSLTVFARIDHAAGAEAAGMTLRPTMLFIFGAARGGTPLMQAAQTVGIDLPLKILIWQDETGETQVSYNDPSWLAKRHELGDAAAASVKGLAGVLGAIVAAATA